MRIVRIAAGVAVALLLAAGIGFLLRPVSYYNGNMYLHEALTGVKNRIVFVHGYRIHYLLEGPSGGQPVVLIHGLGGRSEDWRNLAPYLAAAGFHVYIPDLPGFGRSQQPSDFSYTVRDQAGIVIGFLDAMGLQRVDLGGWSMGGWIVQIAAGEAPQRINRLMLFDSAGLHAVPDWNTQLFTPRNAEDLKELDALLMPNPPPVPGFVSRDILRLSRQHAWLVHRSMAAMLTGRDVTDSLLPQLTMPVLIAWGAEDRITPLDLGEKMHRLLPQSEFDVFADCGHLAPMQCAGQMGPKVVAFEEKSSPAAR